MDFWAWPKIAITSIKTHETNRQLEIAAQIAIASAKEEAKIAKVRDERQAEANRQATTKEAQIARELADRKSQSDNEIATRQAQVAQELADREEQLARELQERRDQTAAELAANAAQEKEQTIAREQQFAEHQAAENARQADLLQAQKYEADYDRYQRRLLSLTSRFSSMNATLCGIAISEIAIILYLYGRFGPEGHWTLVLFLALLIAIAIALFGLIEFRTKDVIELLKFDNLKQSQRHDDISTLLSNIVETTNLNTKRLSYKETCRTISLALSGLVIAIVVAYTIGFIR